MGRKLEIKLEIAQREELETGYRTGNSHAFRQRCRMILLKADKMVTKDICPIVEIESETQVNTWIKRYRDSYKTEGLSILHNKAGQGRPPVFDKVQDEQKVKAAVKKERQRLSQAKLILEQEMDKSFHLKTLKRFLKNLSADINA